MKKKLEEDPLFPEFDNYNKTIEEDQKMAEMYTSLQGNKFDKGLNKLIKARKEKQRASPDSFTDRNLVVLSPDLATIWPKKSLNTQDNSKNVSRKRAKKDRSAARDQYSNYLKDMP